MVDLSRRWPLGLNTGNWWFPVAAAIAALAAAAQGYAARLMAGWERAGFAIAGLFMIFPALLEHAFGDVLPAPHWIGIGLGIGLLVLNLRNAPATRPG